MKKNFTNRGLVILLIATMITMLTGSIGFGITKPVVKKPVPKKKVVVKKVIPKKTVVKKPIVKKPIIKPIIKPTPTPEVIIPKVASVEINIPDTVEVGDIDKAIVKVTMDPPDSTVPKIEYSVDDTNMATIDDNGNVTFNDNGNVTIAVVVGKVTAAASITVNPKVVDLKASANFNLTNPKFLMVYEKSKIKVNETINPTSEIIPAKFTSSDNSIATIDSDGNVTGLNPGNDTITVTVGNKKVDVPVVVYGETTDTDKDGLTDYQEINKYFTDPEKFSTAGDGVSDGDWDRRREYTYSMDATVNVLKPYYLDKMNTDFQDVKVIKEYDNYSTIEFILYPYSTVYNKFGENPNWKTDDANDPTLQPYLQPGITTNFDDQMKKDLIAELNKNDIYPDKLTDLELVRKVSGWMSLSTKFIDDQGKDVFLTYENNKANIPDKYKSLFSQAPAWSDTDVFNKLVYGKQMYYNKTKGSCESTSTYGATIWKALGIPTRINFQYNYFDYSDIVQQNLIKNNIQNENEKQLLTSLFKDGHGSYDHYYTQVYVGKQWITVENNSVGFNYLTVEPIINLGYINDNSEFDRQTILSKTLNGEVIPNSVLPYQLINISDKYGVNYKTTKNVNFINKKSNMLDKTQFNKNDFMSGDDNILKILKQKTLIDWCGGTGITQEQINDRNMLAIFDDGTMDIAPLIKDTFKDMFTQDKNYLNVKIVNGKLLVYLKAENEQKLEDYINQIDESDLYTEQYINFDKQ